MKEITKRLDGGEIRMIGEANKKLAWHRPKHTVRRTQWQPETGVTRYAWCRERTPKNQLPYWQHLQRVFAANRIEPLSDEDEARLAQLEGDLCEWRQPGFRETIVENQIISRDPTGEWVFIIRAEMWRGAVCDRLILFCSDGHTMPDSQLVLRFRSWTLDDTREAFAWLPGQDRAEEGWANSYDNEIVNSYHLLSPRRVQNGLLLPQASQGEAK